LKRGVCLLARLDHASNQKTREAPHCPRAGSPAGPQRRKRAAVDCTAAQAVAAALLASAMGNTGTASGPRPRLRSGRNLAHCWRYSALAWH